MDLDGAPLPHCVNLLVGLALDVHTVQGEIQMAGDVGAHLVLDGRDLGALQDQGAVQVDDAPSGFMDAPHCLDQEVPGILAFVAGVGVGEELSDVGEGKGAQEGVGDGVVQGVAIGMADGSGVVREADAANDEGPSASGGGRRFESVEVVAVADAQFLHEVLRSRDRSRVAGYPDDEPGVVLSGPAGRILSAGQEKQMSMSRVARLTVLALVGAVSAPVTSVLVGCQSEAGGYWSDDRYVYVSRAWEPKTITLIDTRTGESLWSVDVPVGRELHMGFSKGTGPNEYKPDEVIWEMRENGKRFGSSDNRMPCPPKDVRRVDVTLRSKPEMPGTPVPGSPFRPNGETKPAGYTAPVKGPYIDNKSNVTPPTETTPPPAMTEPAPAPEPIAPPPEPAPAPEPLPDDMLPPR